MQRLPRPRPAHIVPLSLAHHARNCRQLAIVELRTVRCRRFLWKAQTSTNTARFCLCSCQAVRRGSGKKPEAHSQGGGARTGPERTWGTRGPEAEPPTNLAVMDRAFMFQAADPSADSYTSNSGPHTHCQPAPPLASTCERATTRLGTPLARGCMADPTRCQ